MLEDYKPLLFPRRRYTIIKDNIPILYNIIIHYDYYLDNNQINIHSFYIEVIEI